MGVPVGVPVLVWVGMAVGSHMWLDTHTRVPDNAGKQQMGKAALVGPVAAAFAVRESRQLLCVSVVVAARRGSWQGAGGSHPGQRHNW